MSLRTLIFIACGVLLSACATPAAEDAPRGATADATPAPTPALFVARDANSEIYLLGCVHLRRAGDDWNAPRVARALARSRVIWTEIPLTPEVEAQGQALASQLGVSSDRPLASWLDATQQAQLADLEQRYGLPPAALAQMRPWLASLVLSGVPIVRAGFDPQAGVDRGVFNWGVAHGRTMRAFETPEQQIHMFSAWDDDAQRGMLTYALVHADHSAESAGALNEAWSRGDVGAMQRLTTDQLRTQYPRFYSVFYADRNTAWSAALVGEMHGAGVEFVAVGAGHLVGPEGLIAQLRAHGVRVDRVS
jgi:uncharacterized protein YbaP (TraB family)